VLSILTKYALYMARCECSKTPKFFCYGDHKSNIYGETFRTPARPGLPSIENSVGGGPYPCNQTTIRAGPSIKPFKQWLEAPKIGKAPKFYKPTYISPFWSLKYSINFFFFSWLLHKFQKIFFSLSTGCCTGLNSIKSKIFLPAAAVQVLIAKDLFFSL
jgi:hypothetical protein